MNIRIAQINDLERISEIAKISFPLACPPDSDKSELDQYVSTKLDTRFSQKIYVLPEHHGSGIAIMLINEERERG